MDVSAKEVIWSSANRLQNQYLELLESGTLSDAQVCCGERTWKIHKAIVCLRSEWFRKALTGSFKEAETGIIIITDFKENEIDCLLHYIYTGSINVSRSFTEKLGAIASISVWRMGNFFALQDLCKLALDEFNEDLRLASWFFATKESPPEVFSKTINNCIEVVHAVYQQGGCDLFQAFRATSMAFLVSNVHIFGKRKEFKDMLRDIPEFSSDWAVALTDSVVSIKMPLRSLNKCVKCDKLSAAHLDRFKWITEQQVEHFCRRCFPLQRLEGSDGEESDSDDSEDNDNAELHVTKLESRSQDHGK